jgi:hypothetical protein
MVQGSGFRVQGSGYRVQGAGFKTCIATYSSGRKAELTCAWKVLEIRRWTDTSNWADVDGWILCTGET